MDSSPTRSAISWRIYAVAVILPAVATATLTTFFHRISLEVGGNLHDSLHVVWWLQDPQLFGRDEFARVSRAQPLFFWRALAWMIPAGSEARGFFAWAPLANHFLYALGLGCLAAAFTRRPEAWAAAMLLGAGLGEPLLGANFPTSNQFSPTTTVIGPLLMALALGASGRGRAGMALAGAMANIHPYNAIYAGGLMAGGLAARAWAAAREQNQAEGRAGAEGGAGEGRGGRAEWIRLAQGIGLAAVCAAPGIAPVLLRRAASPPPPAGWADYVQLGHEIHYFPFSQPWVQIAKTAAVAMLLGAIAWKWRGPSGGAPDLPDKSDKPEGSDKSDESGAINLTASRATSSRFLAGVLAAWGIGFLATGSLLADVMRLPAAVMLQPLRSTLWLLPILIAALVAVLFEEAAGEDSSSNAIRSSADGAKYLEKRIFRRALIGSAGLILCFNFTRPFQSVFGKEFALIWLPLAAAAWWPARGRWGKTPARLAAALCGALALFPLVFGFLIIYLMPFQENLPWSDAFLHWKFMLALGLALTGGFAWVDCRAEWQCASRPSENQEENLGRDVQATGKRRTGFTWPCFGASLRIWIFLAAFAVIFISGQATSRQFFSKPMWSFPLPDPDWRRMCEWIRHNTAKDAVIQAPPALTGIRTFARRNSFFETNDDSALYIDPAILPVLRERARLLGVPLVKHYFAETSWDPLSVDWRGLRLRHGVTHAILPREVLAPRGPLQFHALHREGEYVLVALD